MRKLILILAEIGLVLYSDPIAVAWGPELNEASLSQEITEGERAENILRLNGGIEGDWLKLGLNGKFLIKPLEDEYSSCGVNFIFPGISNNLVLKTDYDWDEKYKVGNAKLNYSFNPFQSTELGISYLTEKRDPELSSGCPYWLNSESIDFVWQPKPWKYSFNLARNDKDYYEDSQYTSLKYQLGEAIAWHPRPNLGCQLEYQENTGDYATSGYKDFWKEEWIFDSDYQSKAKWQYELEYRKMYWERGYEPYRSSYKLQFKMGRNLNTVFKLNFGASLQDLNYFSQTQDYSEPGVYNPIERDLKSRVVSKFGMELQADDSDFSWKVGPFWGLTRYASALVKDVNRLGVYGTIIWKFQYIELSLKLAPTGDLLTQDSYYQIEITYKPRNKTI
ncbi:MAG TPA: hypothetical protein DDW50_09915 [Firmicutes bacterium]|jgi:hypothetical protein|nr:hypothetical protein [Bacillota bacterium]